MRALVIFLALCALASAYPRRRQFTTESNEDDSGDYNYDYKEESNEVSVDESKGEDSSEEYSESEGSDEEVDDMSTGEPIALPLSNDKFKPRLQNQPLHTNYQQRQQGRMQFTTESNEDGSGDYSNDDNEESDEVSFDENPSVLLIRRNLEPSAEYNYEKYSDEEVDDMSTGEPIALPLSNEKLKIRLQNHPKHTNYPHRPQERRRSIKESNEESNEESNDDSNKSQSREYDDKSNFKTERPLDLEPSTEDSYYEDLLI